MSKLVQTPLQDWGSSAMEVQHLHTPVVSSTTRQAKHKLMTCMISILCIINVLLWQTCRHRLLIARAVVWNVAVNRKPARLRPRFGGRLLEDRFVRKLHLFQTLYHTVTSRHISALSLYGDTPRTWFRVPGARLSRFSACNIESWEYVREWVGAKPGLWTLDWTHGLNCGLIFGLGFGLTRLDWVFLPCSGAANVYSSNRSQVSVVSGVNQ